ncbi:T9SS type A sorting domain-containing protein [Bacteroidales bacterium OttesenSCG-928-A17]|nr:T9SS type A sorting domain-containing protein [Bacteroidales bacterium OttesenSCG-928-A17]
MKTKLILSISLILCFSYSVFAQTDAEKYWIKEDFSLFITEGNWNATKNYSSLPNDVILSVKQANVETSSGCAAFNIPGGKQMRIRGLFYDGYLEFTVPDASIVKIYVTGKSDLLDRSARIYRNNELIKSYGEIVDEVVDGVTKKVVKGIDETICCKFVDKVNSSSPVTYKITAGEEGSTPPVAVYYIEVLKYGQVDPEAIADTNEYWIKEDFSRFDVENDEYNASKSYTSYPNNVQLQTTQANIELNSNDGCARTNWGYGNQLRIRGQSDNDGSLEFTLEDAGIVRLYISGKSSTEDRSIKIFRDGELIQAYEKLDKNVCRVFTDEVFSESPVTYKITTGNPDPNSINLNNPVAIYGIEAEKYHTPPSKDDYSSYWIYEDFSSFQVESGYSSNWYETFPEEIKLYSEFANVEWGASCTKGTNIIRISGKADPEAGSLEFTVPDYEEILIGVTGKSDALDRNVDIHVNGELAESIANLDRDECIEFSMTNPSQAPATIKITGVNSIEKPAALNYIYVMKNKATAINNPDISSVSVYPNPVEDVVYFRFENGNPAQKAFIIDLSGRSVLSGIGVDYMNVSSLPKGLYILKLESEEGVFSHKLIKK